MLALLAAAPLHDAWSHPGGDPVASPAQTLDPVGASTLNRRLVGPNPADGWALLGSGPGEPHVVREELVPAQRGRASRRRSLIYLAQLSDFQLADEQSPARVEYADPAASSAWRPQEALVPHQVEYTIRQVNRYLDSPIAQGNGRRARLRNAVLTGDQADNMQLNESQWVIRLMQGGRVDPSSGTQDLDHPLCPPTGANVRDFDDPRQYTGLQDYRDYLVPHPSFYDPQDVRGIYAARNWPSYPNLMDRAQDPFDAVGLRVPSYVAFGNHDLLVQGNQWASAGFEEVATGCVKPLTGPAEQAVQTPPADLLTRALTEPDRFSLVPRDESRRFIDRREFKALHATGHQQDQHGFAYVDPQELAASNGAASYYSFAPRQGIRYIVLDTVSTGGVTSESSGGRIDDPQFQWLQRELEAAQEREELILVFAHHVGESLRARVPDEAAPPCTASGRDPNAGCDRDPRSSIPIRLETDLDGLLHSFPNVIALIGGHSHQNRVRERAREGGGYWEIKTPAIVDWPTQHRLIEVMDNRDGTLSIFGTMLDHDGPLEAPPAGKDARDMSLDELVALGRTLSYNDPQAGPGESAQFEGDPPTREQAGRVGLRADRNVELLIANPRAAAVEPTQPAPRPRPRRRSQEREERAAGEDTSRPGAGETAGSAEGGRLPFTGRDLLILALAAVALASAGAAMRRRLRAPA